MEFLNEGNSLFVDEQYESALGLYDKACSQLTTNAEAFFKRAQCHYKLSNLKESLSDINSSIKINPNNSKYYLKKGQICFELEEFESALKTFEKGQSVDPENTQFKTWIRKAKAEIQSTNPTTTTTTSKPEESKPTPTPTPTPAPKVQTPTPTPTTTPAPATTTTTPTPTPTTNNTAPKLPIASSGNKVKHEWYQTATHVVLTIFAKFVTESNSKITLSSKSISVSFMMATGSEYLFEVDLFDPIFEKESNIQYFSTKVEIKMKKSRAIKWDTLEFTEKASGPVGLMDTESSGTATTTTTNKPGVPSPYASKKDWDKIETGPEDKLEGDQALNKVFRDIFSKGTEEQQRAMMKSFTESGGTVLSTNWDEVGSKKVEGSAPNGMEMKEYPK